jgi:hypothetical protein
MGTGGPGIGFGVPSFCFGLVEKGSLGCTVDRLGWMVEMDMRLSG